MSRLAALLLFSLLAASCSSAEDATAAGTSSTPAPTTETAVEDSAGNDGADNDGADNDSASSDIAAGDEAASDTDTSASDTTVASQTSVAPLSGSYVATPVTSFPHDADAYTQGLEFIGDRMLESTGLFGQSDRRWVDPATGSVEDIVDLEAELFGEGLTVVDDRIIQITWQAGQAIVSDLELNEIERFTYAGEGWGLCYDGTQLIMSDGSATLTFRDPISFEPTGTVEVVRDGRPVPLLNELECVGEQVFANIYTSDEIVVIDPTTGDVDASIDGSPLRPSDLPVTDANFALNGIAHRTDTGQFYLTGKWWPVLYEVVFEPAP